MKTETITGQARRAPSLAADQEKQLLQFLQLCLRGRWDPTAANLAREMAGSVLTPLVDWDGLYQLAVAENVAPLFYLVMRPQQILPTAVEGRFRQVYLQNVLRNTLLFYELDQLLSALAAAGIATLVLKGAALSKTVYEDIGIRPMLDLDLLIKRENLATALQILSGCGFIPITVETHPGAVVAHENEFMLFKPGKMGIPLELHWTFFDSPYYQNNLSLEWFWQTSLPTPGTPIPTKGDPYIRILGPEAQVLHLCGHLLLHHSTGGGNTTVQNFAGKSGINKYNLHWLHDIAEVVGFYREKIDWDRLIVKAQEYNLVLPLQIVIPQIVTEWGAAVPPDIQARLASLRPSAAEKRVFTALTAEDRSVAIRFRDDLVNIPGWRARILFAWQNVFPTSAYMRTRYHIKYGWLLPLYYPYRWILGLRSLFSHILM